MKKIYNFTLTYSYWKSLVDPYLKSREVWICPSNPNADDLCYLYPTYGSLNKFPFKPFSYVASFSFWCEYESDIDEDYFMLSRNLRDIPNPSEVIMVFETTDFFSRFPVEVFPFVSGEKSRLPIWHHGGGEWLFGDAHVRWMKPRQTLAPRSLWMPDYRVATGEMSQADWDQTLRKALDEMNQSPLFK